MSTERTDSEILARIKEVAERDWLGTQRDELAARLSFQAAKSLVKPEAEEADWTQYPRDRDSILKEMLEYMPFAWDKANHCRGISAGRSIDHYDAWLWLLGDDLKNFGEYEHYGKQILVRICEKYGWDESQWDDGIRVNSESEL